MHALAVDSLHLMPEGPKGLAEKLSESVKRISEE